MLRHAYEATTLSRQYQAAPFPAEAEGEGGLLSPSRPSFL